MNRGIYLVANLKSQAMCENLIYSIRESGCTLPIRLIHFGGKAIQSPYVLDQVELLYYETFPDEVKQFIHNLSSVLSECPTGFLYRYIAWFLDWDEFIYSDNDVVALVNWEVLFGYLDGYDLVHADEEYRTHGVFNYYKPELIQQHFGESALDSAITAGHIVVRKSQEMIADINNAVKWFEQYPDIPQRHDQSLMHIASLLGKWKVLNLCKPPHNWLSSWAGDHKNALALILSIQGKSPNTRISHLHFSGGEPSGIKPIHDLLYSCFTAQRRLYLIVSKSLKASSGYSFLAGKKSRALKKLKKYLRS